MGGEIKTSTQTAISRARHFVDQKKHSNFRRFHSDDRALLLHVLRSRFGATPQQLCEAFPWSRTTIYDSLSVGQWMEEKHNTPTVKKRIEEIVAYLLYNDRYSS